MKRILIVLTSIVLVFTLCGNAFAATSDSGFYIKYPDDYPYTLTETADGYRFTVDTSDSCYWERYRDDTLRFTYTGSTVDGSSMLKLIDNISFLLYPFGKDTFVPLSGLNADFATNFNIVFDASMVVPEDFKIIVKSAYGIIDSSGTAFFTEFRNLLTFDYSVGTDGFGFGVNSDEVEISSGDLPVSIVYLVEFEGIDAENDDTSISFSLSQDSEVSFIVTDAFVESLQHDELKDRLDGMIDKQQQTNDKLDDIEQGIVGPGGTNDKLDDIEQGIVGPGGTNDKLDDIEQGIVGPGGTNDKLDDIEQGIVGPGGTNDKLDDMNDKLDDVTDYIPEPDGPEGGDISGGLVDAEDKLLDEVQDGMNVVDDIQTEAQTSFLTYVHAVSVMTWMLNLIIEGSVMRGVLVVSLALGTCAFLLNLSVQLAKDSSKSSKNTGKNRNSAKTQRRSRP